MGECEVARPGRWDSMFSLDLAECFGFASFYSGLLLRTGRDGSARPGKSGLKSTPCSLVREQELNERVRFEGSPPYPVMFWEACCLISVHRNAAVQPNRLLRRKLKGLGGDFSKVSLELVFFLIQQPNPTHMPLLMQPNQLNTDCICRGRGEAVRKVSLG